MLAEFRRWLESELRTLGNASHHAYSFGQANMAKRAIERFDAATAGRLLIALDRETAHNAAEAIDVGLQHGETSNDALRALGEALHAALKEPGDEAAVD